jgi:diguanylate cyclase (GGDEF)-like protein
MLDTSIFSTIHPDDVGRAQADFRKATAGSDRINIELRIRNANTDWRWISWTTPGFSTETDALYAIGRDITSQKALEQELLFQVQHDGLTKLKNRMVFEQAARSAVSRAERNPAVQVALLNIDLDGFKVINDTYGHAAGDLVLKTVAVRFTQLQRVTDIVCRLGGDEFAWILEGAKPLQADALARKITEVVAMPIPYDCVDLSVGCSVGVAMYTDAMAGVDALCEAADAAMYAVKRSRPSR